MERQKPYNNIDSKEYGFFIRQSLEKFEAGNSIQENTFETWKQGKANTKLCWTISVEELAIEQFLRDWKTVYIYCECILTPENSKVTIEEINNKLQNSFKSEMSEMDKLKLQISELIEELDKKQVLTSKKSTK